MNSTQPIEVVQPLAAEESARADLYALLARLFYAGPTPELLVDIVASGPLPGQGESPLAQAWRGLQAASAVIDAATARQEYEDLFIGVGRAPISIYASHYLSETWKESTLVNLRDELERLGLRRQPGAVEPEDHLAGLLDVMRHLILGAQGGDVALQEGFFRSYLAAWYSRFVAAIEAQPQAAYYKSLGALLSAFFDIEVECFQIA